MTSELYVKPSELPSIDLGHGTEATIYNWDTEASKCPVSKWVNQDGKTVWLTTRQLQCLYLALEVGADEAGYLLGLSPQTVKNHLSKLFKKLAVMTKWEAASALGWVKYPQALLDAPLGAPDETAG